MKSIQIFTALILAFFVITGVSAQETEKQSAGFGGPSFQAAQIDGEWGFEAGGFGAYFITDNIYLGGGGFGLSVEKDAYDYNMGCGGLMFGYVIAPERKIHLNTYLLGGWGGITEKSRDGAKESDDLFILKPSLEAELNITHWMRLAVGGGYKLVMGADIPSLDNDDLSSPYASISLRFGLYRK